METKTRPKIIPLVGIEVLMYNKRLVIEIVLLLLLLLLFFQYRGTRKYDLRRWGEIGQMKS